MNENVSYNDCCPSSNQIEKLHDELSVANNERDSAETRCVNLNIALAEKTRQLEKSIAEHRSQKLSLDTLVQCYKVYSTSSHLLSVTRKHSSLGSLGHLIQYNFTVVSFKLHKSNSLFIVKSVQGGLFK